MLELLTSEIVKIATLVPGLAGLSDIDITSKPEPLVESEWSRGIALEETSQGIKITVAILVDSEVRATTVVTALVSSIKSVFRKRNAKVINVLVSIRGVK